MAKIENLETLQVGDVLKSFRSGTRVYPLSESYASGGFPAKGKAIVLAPVQRLMLRDDRMVYDHKKKEMVLRKRRIKKNVMILMHYQHGIVMYFSHNPLRDLKWHLFKKDN